MGSESDFLAGASLPHIYAYLDSLTALANKGKWSPKVEELWQRFGYLQKELGRAKDLNEKLLAQLENVQEKAEEAKRLAPAQEFDKYVNLNSDLNWLTGKFRLSLDFPLFQIKPWDNFAEFLRTRLDLVAPGGSATVKDEIQYRYLAALNIGNPDEILAVCENVCAAVKSLRAGIQPLYAVCGQFRAYFLASHACLEGVGNVPDLMQTPENAAKGLAEFYSSVNECEKAANDLNCALRERHELITQIRLLAEANANMPDQEYRQSFRPMGALEKFISMIKG